jgi:competence protein ComEC
MTKPPKRFNPNDSNNLIDLVNRGLEYAHENPRKTALGGLIVGWGMLSGNEDSESTRSDLEFYVWDVEHGDAMLIKSPEANIVVDLGRHQNGFSPTKQIRKHGIEQIDLLVISHPDLDHIQDITTFFEHFTPQYIMHPSGDLPYIEHKKNKQYPNDQSYQAIAGEYVRTRKNHNHVMDSPLQFGELVVHEFSLTPEELGFSQPDQLPNDRCPSLNNLSVLNIFEYNDFKLATMGDLESEAIEMMLEKPGVVDALNGTDILLAPHHGRQSSFSPALLNRIDPDIIGISDSGGTEHNAISKYSRQASGKLAESRNSEDKMRYTVTTRKDGVLYFGAKSDGTYKVVID